MADDLPDAPWVKKEELPDAPWATQASDSGFSWSKAITDIPSEIGKEASSAAGDIAALGNRSEQGPIEGLMTTGKAVAAVPRLIASPITGATRSLIGHPMANVEHAIGTVINPEAAAKDNPEQMYETAKGDVDTAMAAARPAGSPIRVASAGITTPHPTVPGATVTTGPRPHYEWNAPPVPQKPIGVVKQPETSDFFDAADQHYSNMRGFGVEIHPSAINGVADNILTELHTEGYRPRNAPKVFDAIEELRNPAGQYHEISDIDSVRKVLGKARLDHTERDAARRAIGHIDDYLANLRNTPQDIAINPQFADRVSDEALMARGNYAVAKRSEDIDEAIDKAHRQAASAGAGGNINNAIRQQLKSLRNNKKKMTGWTDSEKSELDSVINGTATSNAARQAGKFAPHGIVSTAMSAGAGHMIAPGIGEVAVPAMGWIAKKIADRMTKKGAERLSDVIKARSPLGKQTSINAAAQAALAPPKTSPNLLPSAVGLGTKRLPNVEIRPLTGLVPSAAQDEKENRNSLRSNQPDQDISGKEHGGSVSKKTKASVNYRHATGKERCKTCKHSYGPTSDRKCELVAGRIFPDDTCNLWAAKEYALGGAVHNHNPTEAQKKAGNYAKTHKSFHGLDITIENLKGHSRSGIGKDGKKWSVRMPAHYGYIKRTEGADGDHVDCYLGPNEKSDQVFVVDQKDAETGRFDEHKCLLGFNSESEARKTYLAGFSDGKNRIKHMRRMSLSEFKDWLQNGDTSKQIAHYALGGAVHRAIKPDVYL